MRPFDYPLNAQARFSQNLWIRGAIPPAKNCCLCCARPRSRCRRTGDYRGRERYPPAHLRRVNGVALCLIDHYFADLASGRRCNASTAARCTIFCASNGDCAAPQPDADQRPPRPGQECQRLEIPNMSPLLCVRTLNTVTVKAARRSTPSA